MLYQCPECHTTLRARCGSQRRHHFYHTTSSRCRLRQRSVFHRKIQNFILQQLAPEPIVLEHPFPSIGRIADIVWPAHNLVIEIQCSSIRAEEVKKRMSDYAEAGYRVIWILHDHRFNRHTLSDAEVFLQDHPHFFISNHLFLYQQLAKIRGNRRLERSPRFALRPRELINPPSRTWTASPKQKRLGFNPFRIIFNHLLEKRCN